MQTATQFGLHAAIIKCYYLLVLSYFYLLPTIYVGVSKATAQKNFFPRHGIFVYDEC